MTLLVAVALSLSGALAAPHLIRLDEAQPAVAAAVWFCALLLRAATTIVVIAFFVVVAPATGLYQAVALWCWHAVLPLFAAHLGLDGHSVVDAAILFPASMLAFSAVSVAVGLVKAARKVRRLLSGSGLGPGPSDSVIIRDGVVLVAAAGLRRPRVVVSAGALARLDDAELHASLDHERGHIDRRHRWILVIGELARAIGRFVPGARTAFAELTFHLERDADRFALSHHHPPRALASAICKAAQGGPWTASPSAGLGGSAVVRRVSQLVGEAPPARSPVMSRALALLLASLALGVLVAVPPATLAAVRSSGAPWSAPTCPH